MIKEAQTQQQNNSSSSSAIFNDIEQINEVSPPFFFWKKFNSSSSFMLHLKFSIDLKHPKKSNAFFCPLRNNSQGAD